MNNQLTFIIGIMGTTWLVVILALAFTPYFIRKNIAFGISVPENEYFNPLLKELRRKYTIGCIAGGVILALVSFAFYSWIAPDKAIWIQQGLLVLYVIVGALLFFWMRNKVKRIKQASDWQIETKAVAQISAKNAETKILSMTWYLLYLSVIVLTILVTVIKYPSLPGEIPMHYNLAGEVDRYAAKSVGTFVMMPVTQLLMALLFTGINLSIGLTKRERDFKKDNIFRRIMSLTLFVVGMMIMLLFTSVQLSMLNILDEKMMTVLPIGFLIVTVAIFAYLARKVGQGGNRLKGQTDSPINRVDDDSHWIGGFFYFNKADPSIYVEKRFGMGYTLNFGNPISLVVMLAILLLIGLPLIIK